MKKILLVGAALLALLVPAAVIAASQVFPFAGVFADASAAYLMGPNGTAAASSTNPIPTQLSNGNVAASATNPVPVSTQGVGAEYETVAASQTTQAMGATGALGDYLDHCVIIVATAATAATSIIDNATTIVAFANSPGGGIGTYDIPIKARSTSGAWKITTGAGASVVCTGDFT
jgi:hypothetical protein